ncbi:LytR/AlgR family response regulator transcription factor [Mycoplasma sp. P36-A1]|uniref:LytR/AlgR family response regulator transcription factor n=1 Tax=Mycoplasma sp. P36-A1 TaxID=3252900 RepID=UPI003C2ED379
MNSFYIAICQKNQNNTNYLASTIKKYFKDKNIDIKIDYFSECDTFLEASLTCNYSFSFIDIQIDNAHSIEIITGLKKANNLKTKFIFILDYSLFKVYMNYLHSFDYIIKPFSTKQVLYLLDVVNPWFKDFSSHHSTLVSFKTIAGYVQVPINSIIYIEYVNRKVRLVLDNEIYYISSTVKDINAKLVHFNFSHTHAAYIINLKRIKMFYNNNKVIMDNNHEIPVAQKRMKEFKKAYFKYVDSYGLLI